MTLATPPTGSAPETALLSVRDLAVSFHVRHEAPVEAVRGVSFEVPRHRTVALVGESGSGKSVTAMSLLRLLPQNAQVRGSALFEGRDLLTLPEGELRRLRGAAISVVFQEPMSSLNPVFTIGDQIGEVLKIHRQAPGRVRERTLELLEEVGLPDPALRLRSYPHELSGGQQQRVMIAMAIACNPRLLIADEPTTALDVTVQKQILDLLAGLSERHGMSVLFITHDLGIVGEFADDVIVMRQGVVREAGTVDALFQHAHDAYTRALIACRPRLDARPRRLPVVADFMEPGRHPEAQPDRPVRMDGETILAVHHLSKTFQLRDGWFQKRELRAVDDVSFTLRRGRTLGLVGESGSGKTTVGLSIMRLNGEVQGEAFLTVDGAAPVDLFKLSPAALLPYRRRMQIVFQNPYASLNPRMTVGQILMEPLRIHGLGADDRERQATAAALLEQVGLEALALRKYPHEFSGGQRQRIAIARCLTLNPDVLICDESVSALDVSVQAQVLNLLLDLQERYGLAYLFISHDLAVVRYMADEVMVMNKGKIVEVADSETLYRAPQNPYTKKLLEAVPRGAADSLAA